MCYSVIKWWVGVRENASDTSGVTKDASVVTVLTTVAWESFAGQC